MLNVTKRNLIPLMFSTSVIGIIFDLYIPNIFMIFPVILIVQVLLFFFCDFVREHETVSWKLFFAAVMAGIIIVTIIGAKNLIYILINVFHGYSD